MVSPPLYVAFEFVLLAFARMCLGRAKYRVAFAMSSALGIAMGVYGLGAERWYDSTYKEDGLGALVIAGGSLFVLIGFGVVLLAAAWAAVRDARRAKSTKIPRDAA